jgi:hypothetical protein
MQRFAVEERQVGAGDDAANAGQFLGPRSVDADDARVRIAAAQGAAEEHARELHVFEEQGAAGDFFAGIVAQRALADVAERFAIGRFRDPGQSGLHKGLPPPPQLRLAQRV